MPTPPPPDFVPGDKVTVARAAPPHVPEIATVHQAVWMYRGYWLYYLEHGRCYRQSDTLTLLEAAPNRPAAVEATLRLGLQSQHVYDTDPVYAEPSHPLQVSTGNTYPIDVCPECVGCGQSDQYPYWPAHPITNSNGRPLPARYHTCYVCKGTGKHYVIAHLETIYAADSAALTAALQKWQRLGNLFMHTLHRYSVTRHPRYLTRLRRLGTIIGLGVFTYE